MLNMEGILNESFDFPSGIGTDEDVRFVMINNFARCKPKFREGLNDIINFKHTNL